MKKILVIGFFLTLLANKISAQTTHFNVERFDDNYTIIDLPLMAKEVIEYSVVDTTFLRSRIIQDKFRTAEDIKPYDLYINDFCVNALVDSLKIYRNEDNAITVDSIISSIPIHTPILEGFKWREIYSTGYDSDHYNFDDYVLFVLLYKGENELSPLLEIGNGSLWKNVLLDYDHGEKIVGEVKYSNKTQWEYEKKRVYYIIDRWSGSQLSQAEELILALYSSLVYLEENPVDAKTLLTGTWKGKMGYTNQYITVQIQVEQEYVILSYVWKSIEKKNIRLRYYDYGISIESDKEDSKNNGIYFRLSRSGYLSFRLGNSMSSKLFKIK